MKNKSKIKSIILVIGIIFVLLTINNYNIFDNQGENEGTIENQNEHYLKKPKLSGAYTEPFIHIDDNWTATLAKPWCNIVNGRYVIENVTIDASSSPTGSGIFINNSKTNYFIVRNCTIFNAKSGGFDAGIRLENTNNGTIINNNCSNNLRNGIFLLNYCENNTISGNTVSNKGTSNQNHGIYLYIGCDNNTISGNTANNNIEHGIFLMNQCDNNTISGNTANENNAYGIYLYDECDGNIISGNTANKSGVGIYLRVTCNNNTISGNTANHSIVCGICLYTDCNNNTILGNTASDNNQHGIYLNSECDNNTISGNTANDNNLHGIHLISECDNNTISGNTADDNGEYGIYLDDDCDNNIISGNNASNIITANQNIGIYLSSECDNNTISGNTANDNILHGIGLYNSYRAELSGNNMKKCGVLVKGSFTQMSSHIIYPNNIVNEKFLYYYVNDTGLNTINFTGAGQVILINCNNSVISNLNVSRTSIGIHLYHCSNNIILGNTANDNTERGIYFDTDCRNNIISENTADDNGEYGIYLNSECDNNIILENTASNTITTNQNMGIYLHSECDDNIILGNTANDNIVRGIWLNNQCGNNTISGNTVNDNGEFGIFLFNDCNNNTISGNIASNNITTNQHTGIYLNGECDNSVISGNTANDNIEFGIWLNNQCDNNTISGNTANNNIQHGIFLFNDCNNNTISGNTINDNLARGIWLNNQCDNNTVTENIIFNNSVGIQLEADCFDNVLFYNYFFNNSNNNGFDLGSNYWDNGVIGNYWDNYTGIDTDYNGIGETPYNVPGGAGNKDNKPIMIYNALFFKSPDDLTYEVGTVGHDIKWIVINPSLLPLTFNVFMDGTSIKTGQSFPAKNEIVINVDGLESGTYGFTIEVNDGSGGTFTDGVWVTIINTVPVFTATPSDFSYEVGNTGNNISWTFSDLSTNNPTYTINRNGVPIIIDNPCFSDEIIEIPVDGLNIGSNCYVIEINDGYDGIIQDSAWVNVINTLPVFTLKSNDTSYEVGSTGNNLSWTFSDLSTYNPTYTITRDSLPLIIDAPCISGEAINISADGLEAGSYCFEIEINDGYGETIKDATWVTVKSSMELNSLYVEIFEQSFSEKEFNITFSVYNESSQGIDSATIQMWWNGTDVSDNVVDLGNGLYFVSLEPITVAPGDDLILLNMVISASGYEDKHYETYLAVDPETLEKGVEKKGDEFPFLITIIAIVSVAGGIGATIITLGILRKRKGISEVI